jgi:hypothetical protein
MSEGAASVVDNNPRERECRAKGRNETHSRMEKTDGDYSIEMPWLEE